MFIDPFFKSSKSDKCYVGSSSNRWNRFETQYRSIQHLIFKVPDLGVSVGFLGRCYPWGCGETGEIYKWAKEQKVIGKAY
jgi:hypothetical protein